MVEADIVGHFLPALQRYHFVVSMIAAVTVVAAVQHSGQNPDNGAVPAKLRRASLGVLSVALFCSGIRMPVLAAQVPLALLSAAAVNTAILLVTIPIAMPDWREILQWRKSEKDKNS